MLNGLKRWFKRHVPKHSALWNLLMAGDNVRLALERLQSKAFMIVLPFIKINRLSRFESKVFSQNGEDGILEAVFRKIGVTNRCCVEFGVGDGSECNTRYLREKRGWNALLMDPADNGPSWIRKEFVTRDNINQLFKKYGVPGEFDLLSVDVDGNDYWLWKAIDEEYEPRVVVIEYNAAIPPTESKTVAYDPDHQWDGTDYFGASLLALVKLAQSKGYTLVGCDRNGVNAFFVRNDIALKHFVIKGIRAHYRGPGYSNPEGTKGWPHSSKSMVQV